MSDNIMFMIGDDGEATMYDDTYDITIHCESKEEQDEAMRLLKNVSPERKTGRWIEKSVIHEVESSSPIEQWQSASCSVCGKYHTTPYMYYFDDYAFCPNCGAKMEDVCK